MSNPIDDLRERVQTLEAKMDQVPASIDRRFDAVDAAIREQREYTEFAFDKHERRFDQLEGRFDGLEGRFDKLERRFGPIESGLAGMTAELAGVKSGVARLERKLDQFIDRYLPPLRQDPPEQPQ